MVHAQVAGPAYIHGLHDVGDQHRMVSGQGPATFTDDVRVGAPVASTPRGWR